MIHPKVRMNSTNVSEESDSYSEVEDHVDVESEDHVDVESDGHDISGTAADLRIQERLHGVAEVQRHDSNNSSSQRDSSYNVCSKQSEKVTKPAVRPSFLITDILSDTKRLDSETDTSVANTPCSPCTPVARAIDIHKTAALLAQRASTSPALLSSPSNRCESPESDEGKIHSIPVFYM